jgi:predicted HicB family RNase H-like nuclease
MEETKKKRIGLEKMLQVRLSEHEMGEIERAATADGMSLSAWVRRELAMAVERSDQRRGARGEPIRPRA